MCLIIRVLFHIFLLLVQKPFYLNKTYNIFVIIYLNFWHFHTGVFFKNAQTENVHVSELTPVFCLVLQMAEEISKPLSGAQKVTMVSSGSSEVGAAKLAGEVLDIMTRLPAAVEKLTGIDISQVHWSMCMIDHIRLSD